MVGRDFVHFVLGCVTGGLVGLVVARWMAKKLRAWNERVVLAAEKQQPVEDDLDVPFSESASCLLPHRRHARSPAMAHVRVSHDLPLFHDRDPIHTHAMCGGCLTFQRDLAIHKGSAGKLFKCKACSTALYCVASASARTLPGPTPLLHNTNTIARIPELTRKDLIWSKKCQVDAWPQHKADCKNVQRENADIKKRCGIDIETGYLDLMQWIEYYEAPLKNALVVALHLREQPAARGSSKERDLMLDVRLHHKGTAADLGGLPAKHRFEIISIGLTNHREAPELFLGSYLGYEAARERGKIEQGRQFHGIGRMGFTAHYGDLSLGVTASYIKMFAIDKDTARAKPTTDQWWTLFRQYVEAGAKMRFCCGRVPGVEGVCYCGGWTHDEEKKVRGG
uniref:MYND-type domain-containing protein n=1 Tax=Mycena chlorophos TaxID=658473 RepID=A0ABQ0L6X6_MYCCL|nr:predicted protein [Mycena chlorophos]